MTFEEYVKYKKEYEEYEKGEHKTEPKVEPKTEPKVEPKTEPKVEPKTEPKVEPKVEPKSDPETVSIDEFNKLKEEMELLKKAYAPSIVDIKPEGIYDIVKKLVI